MTDPKDRKHEDKQKQESNVGVNPSKFDSDNDLSKDYKKDGTKTPVKGDIDGDTQRNKEKSMNAGEKTPQSGKQDERAD